MKNSKKAIIKWLLLALAAFFITVFLGRVLISQIINLADLSVYGPQKKQVKNNSESNPLDEVQVCPDSEETLLLEEHSTNDFSINIPVGLSQKNTSFFVSPTWLFACKQLGETPGAESVRIYIETAGPFDIKTFRGREDCYTYFENFYDKDDSSFVSEIISVDFGKYSNEFNKCYIKHSLTLPNKEKLIFERLIVLPNSEIYEPRQFDVYAYYPSNSPANIVKALGDSINSFKLKN